MIVIEHWKQITGTLETDACLRDMDHRPCALLHGDGQWVIFGRDPGLVLDSLPDELVMDRNGDIPPILPDLIGWITYEQGLELDTAFPSPKGHRLPGTRLVLFREMTICHLPSGRVFQCIRALPSLDMTCAVRTEPFHAKQIGDTETRDSYMEKVHAVRNEIARGNVYQANLTRTETWAIDGDTRQFARRLAAANPAPFSCCIRMPDWTIVSSSPERFLKLADGRLTASPIKGTIGRGSDPTEDRRLAEFLQHDMKNRSELAMITDLLRNDLGRVCEPGTVRVDGFPVLESYANVHHLVSHISGQLVRGTGLKEILAATFPGGSITGCPRIAAVHLLDRLEPEPRGIYTGAIGWMQADLTACDLNIAIRTCALNADILTFGVGGGIVWDSEPDLEYDETVVKGRSIVQCLS